MRKRNYSDSDLIKPCQSCGKEMNWYNDLIKSGKRKGKRQWPNEFLTRKFCSKKCHSRSQLLSYSKDFIFKAQKIHGDLYKYNKTNYLNVSTKVIIHCVKHGDFKITPHAHLSKKRGCPKCSRVDHGKKRRTSVDAFIVKANKVHNNKYDYQNVKYINSKNKVRIICPVHGEFEQTPGNHLWGYGCKSCAHDSLGKLKRHSKEDFIRKAIKIHGDKYDYFDSEYITDNRKIEIRCDIHGLFKQTPNSHLRGRGCPKCFNKNEGKIAVILNERSIYFRNYRIDNKYYDFYIPDMNILIERDGEQHYPSVWKRKSIFQKKQGMNYFSEHKNDILKTKIAKENGFKIYRIPYWVDRRELEREIDNILIGKPSYPDIPDPNHEITKPKPNRY